MHDVVVTLLGAAAGGLFSATLGALLAFVFCGVGVVLGVVVVIASGDSTFLNAVGFGRAGLSADHVPPDAPREPGSTSPERPPDAGWTRRTP
jgi:hypothetical protein